MSISVLDKLRSDRDALTDEIDALVSADDFDPSDPVLTEARSKIEGLDSRIQSIVDWEGRKAASNKVDSLALRHREEKQESEKRDNTVLSIGEAWTRSKAYADYLQAPRGSSGRITQPFAALMESQRRAVLKTDAFPGIIEKTRISPSTAPTQQTPFLDLIPQIGVSTGSVEWVFFPAAAPIAGKVPEGTPKPEAVVAPTLKTVTLNMLAHWVQYSRQFAEDSGALLTYLNQALARGVMDKRELEAIAALIAPGAVPAVPNTGTLLEGIRLGISAVQAAGYRPDAIVANPGDLAQLDISLLGQTLNGPVISQGFWGVQAIPVGAVPSGTAYVGQFSVGMAELVRTEVSTYTTDSDILPDGSSAFRANVLTTIVEARTAPIVHRAEAIVSVPGTVVAAEGAPQSARKS